MGKSDPKRLPLLERTFLILHTKDILGKLYVVLYLSALLIEVRLLTFSVFSTTQYLSTGKVVMTIGMSLPFFFRSDFLRFVKMNRIFLLLVGAFLTSGIFSTIYSPFSKAYEVKVLTRYGLNVWASFVLVFLLWLKPQLSLFFLKTIAVMAVLSGIISVAEANVASVATWLGSFFGRGTLEMGQGRFRPAATLHHPNILGCFLSIGVLVVVCLKERKEMGPLLFFPSLVIMGIGIAFAGSRNAIIVLAVPLLFLLFNRNAAKTSLIALLVVAACIAASPAASISRFAQLGDISNVASLHYEELPDKNMHWIRAQSAGSKGDDYLARTRLMLWGCAIRMLRDHPIIGIGPGAYNKALKSYAPKELLELERYKIDKEWLHAHNGLLNLLAEFGIFGVLPVILIFTVLFINIFKLYRFPPPQPVHAILLGFVISFVPDAFFFNPFYMILFLSVVLMLSDKKCAPFLSSQ